MNCDDLVNCGDVVTLSALYLAGELDPSRAAEIRKHLETCAVCAHSFAKQAELDARLRDSLLAENQDTEALDRRIRQKIARPRMVRTAAGIAAMLLIALLGYQAWSNARVSRLYADAAVDHHREVVDRQPRSWVTGREAIDALVQRQLLPPSTLSRFASAGYRLERAKLCRLAGRIYLHLVYSNGGGEVSVFLRRPGGDPVPDTLRSTNRGEEYLASVKTDLVAAVVVTDQSSQAARQFATLATSTL